MVGDHQRRAGSEALLRQAGFEGVELFYAGFTFRGWVGYRQA